MSRHAPPRRRKINDAASEIPALIAKLQWRLEIAPSDADRLALGRAWIDAGEPDRAIFALRPLTRKAGRYRASAANTVTVAREMKRLRRSPPGYVRCLFDQFAGNYDRSMLQGLNYRAPVILRSLADMVIGETASLDILDLGCGTGLCGAGFADIARRLDGVDLSPAMLDLARARGIYEQLTCGDLEHVLQMRRRKYDLLIAADTLVYFGDLQSVFAAAASRLRSNGFFLFTTEKQPDGRFGLGPKRRYRHSAGYLRSTAASVGFDVMAMVDCTPRSDGGAPVEGLAVAFRRA